MVDAPDLGSGAARRESSSLSRRTIHAFVAQLDRAQYYGYWGWEFESLRVYIMELWRSWCARWTENPKECSSILTGSTSIVFHGLKIFKVNEFRMNGS